MFFIAYPITFSKYPFSSKNCSEKGKSYESFSRENYFLELNSIKLEQTDYINSIKNKMSQ